MCRYALRETTPGTGLWCISLVSSLYAVLSLSLVMHASVVVAGVVGLLNLLSRFDSSSPFLPQERACILLPDMVHIWQMPYYQKRSTVIMPQPCDSWAEPAEDFAEHKQPQGIRTLARTTFPMWRILNPEYTSTWRWALLKTDDALLMHVLQFAVLLFSPKRKQCYDHGDIKHSRLKRFLEQPQAVSLLHVASGIRKNRGQRCR